MIPREKWSCMTKAKQLTLDGKPIPVPRFSELYDIKLGPAALSAANGRNNAAIWMAYQDEQRVLIRKANFDIWAAATELFTTSDVIEDISLSFDSIGRPVVFYQTGTTLKLWYLNSLTGNREIMTVSTNGSSPTTEFDRRDDTDDATSDVLLFYVEDDKIWMRIQRERYEIAHDQGIQQEGLVIKSVGMTAGHRLQVEYIYRETRNGTLLVQKSLETALPIARDLRGRNLEIKFSIRNAPTWCQILQMANKLEWTQPQEFFTIMEHAGTLEYDKSYDRERLFGIAFKPMSLNPEATEVYLHVYAGATVYGVALLPNYVFNSGDFVFKLETLGSGQKRVTLIRNGIVLFDTATTDLPPLNYLDGGTRNRLRFGAAVYNNNDSLTQYWQMFPATFTNIEVTLDGVKTVWDSAKPALKMTSTPTGNDLTLRRRGKDSFVFPPRT